MIDLRRLQVLRVLHERGTVTAAAHVLHLTPSAVSQQIRQLAQDVGVDLLQRQGRRVRLAPAAYTLLAHADTLYTQWEIARADLAAHADGGPSRLLLCGFPSALSALLAPAAARLRQTHPRLVVRMTEAENTECFDLLLAEHTDIAVVVPLSASPPPDDPRFEQQPLLDDPQDLIVPATHRLAGRDGVELAEAACEPWIAAPGSLDQHQLILVACAAAGFAPRIAHRAQEWNAITALVAHDFGVCLLPRLAPIPADHAILRIPLQGEPTPSRRILTCVRRGSRGQPAIARGLEALQEIARIRMRRETAG